MSSLATRVTHFSRIRQEFARIEYAVDDPRVVSNWLKPYTVDQPGMMQGAEMRRRLRNMFLTTILAGVGLGLGACAILSQDKFGRQPEGERLAGFQASSNFKGSSG